MRISRLPRTLLAIAASLMLAIVLAGVVPWSVPDGAFRDDALRRIALTLNAERLSVGSARLALLPQPHLQLSDVSLALASGGPEITVPVATIDLKTGPLMSGNAKAIGLTLTAPYITLDEPAASASGFRALSDRLVRSSGPLLAATPLNGLTQITIDRGTLALRSRADSRIERYDNLRLRLSLPHRDAPVSLTASANRNNEDIRLTFRGASPNAIAKELVENIAFSLWTPGLAVEFDGKGSLHSKMALNGALLVRAGAKGQPPYAQAFQRMGIAALPPVELAGQLDFNDRGVNLSELKVLFGRDRFDGAATLRHDGARWNVSTTLAGERADLTPVFAPLTRMRSEDRNWNRAAVDSESILAANIDLRLSADSVVIHDLTLGKVALTLQTRANRIEATLAEATVAGGLVRMRLTGAPGSDGLALRLSGALERTRMGDILERFTGARRFSGVGDGQLTLETSGRSMAEFIANADGRFALSLRDGTLHGIDLRKMASRRPGKRPEVALIEALGGQTPFEAANLNARIARGAAEPVEGHMQAGRLVTSMTGAVDFAQGLHALSGSVVEVATEGARTEPKPVLDFTVTGPLTEPVVRPNIAALLNRM